MLQIVLFETTALTMVPFVLLLVLFTETRADAAPQFGPGPDFGQGPPDLGPGPVIGDGPPNLGPGPDFGQGPPDLGPGPDFGTGPDLGPGPDFGVGPGPDFGSGVDDGDDTFTGSDFRCRALGGECKYKYETCCPMGWTLDRTCLNPKWCCYQPTECETLKGKCQDKANTYCPGRYNNTLDCGGPGSFFKCCMKNSPCEVDYSGKCITADTTCNGVVINPEEGEKLCGQDLTYQCCVNPPVGRGSGGCIVGNKEPFCDFLNNNNLTLSNEPNDGTSASANLQDMCNHGNAKRSEEKCGGGTVCLRPKIVDYLTCMQAACPNAEVITVTRNPHTGGRNCKFCNGKAVGLTIDMSIQPATCDITNVEHMCYELKGVGLLEEISTGVYLLTCAFH